MTSRYAETYAAWRRDPQGFWAAAAEEIDWFSRWEKVFDPASGAYGRWFTGASCNTCFNCVDRHAEKRPEATALVYDSPVAGAKRRISYAALLAEVQALAAALRRHGVEKGDRVVLYMPMVPEAIVAMLACARLGAVHSVVFGGFAAPELATRIDDARPKLVVSASCGLEGARIVPYKPLLDAAILRAAHKPEKCLMLQREQHRCELLPGRDFDYAEETARHAGARVECVPVAATDPLYILYTSGTTGQPKGVVRDNGGHMVALKWSMRNVYGVAPGEVFWAASDVGWVVGHSYIVYAPLLHGCTTVLYEGKPVGTPDAGAFWRVIAEHSVAALFTAPTAFRAIKKEDPDGLLLAGYDLKGFRALFLAGERADPDTIRWAEERLGVPVLDHWWQTETAWAIAANALGLGGGPVKYGSAGRPMPGWDLAILDDSGNTLPQGALGNIAVRLPLPPGAFPTLWNAEARFRATYLDAFPGYYKTADAGLLDADGYVFVMSRTDDIINVAGHRLSTGAMEEVLAAHPDVAECAVIGVADALKGQAPRGFVVLKAGRDRAPEDLQAECVARVRAEIGPVAAFRQVHIVKRLPKTRSGKILRATMRQIAEGETPNVPPTIDDPAILDEIRAALGEA
jgi:propionyl-CoA synthetase